MESRIDNSKKLRYIFYAALIIGISFILFIFIAYSKIYDPKFLKTGLVVIILSLVVIVLNHIYLKDPKKYSYSYKI